MAVKCLLRDETQLPGNRKEPKKLSRPRRRDTSEGVAELEGGEILQIIAVGLVGVLVEQLVSDRHTELAAQGNDDTRPRAHAPEPLGHAAALAAIFIKETRLQREQAADVPAVLVTGVVERDQLRLGAGAGFAAEREAMVHVLAQLVFEADFGI